jgi:hypothetical protein
MSHDPASPDNPRVIHLLDERVIASRQGVSLEPGAWRKHDEPLMSFNDRPWEGGGDNGYPNVAFDPQRGVYQLWYSGFVDLHVDSRSVLCYAESRDGLHWTKPELGLCEHRGSRANNIVAPFLCGVGVARDEAAPDPRRRYKMVFLVHPRLSPTWADELAAAGFPCDLSVRGVGVAFSADGIHWDYPPGNPVLRGIAGDTHNHWHRSADGRGFVLITRRNRPWRDGVTRRQKTWKDGQVQTIDTDSERVVKRWLSDDFLHWHSGVDCLEAQGDEVGRRQCYSMPVTRVGEGYVGLLSLFNSQPDDDSVDVELTWSPDLTQWRRIGAGHPVIARGQAGEPDAGTIYAAWQPALPVGDEQRLYYAASPLTHSGGPARHNTLRLATQRRDRWAGWRSEASGTLVTTPIRLGDELSINVDAAGEVRVELRDSQGLPLPGFSFSACDPIRGDLVRAAVRWRQTHERMPEGPVQIALSLRQAIVYSLTTGPRGE